MTENTRIGVAEAIGTMILVLGGCGTAVLAGSVVGFAGVATAFGLSLLIMAYTIGPISGCHVNPAVTIGMLLAGKIEASKAPFYVGGQILGGLVGGALLWITLKISDMPAGAFATNGYGDRSPMGFELGSVAIMEILMTALLLLVVLGTTHSKFPAGFGGIAAGVALLLYYAVADKRKKQGQPL